MDDVMERLVGEAAPFETVESELILRVLGGSDSQHVTEEVAAGAVGPGLDRRRRDRVGERQRPFEEAVPDREPVAAPSP